LWKIKTRTRIGLEQLTGQEQRNQRIEQKLGEDKKTYDYNVAEDDLRREAGYSDAARGTLFFCHVTLIYF